MISTKAAYDIQGEKPKVFALQFLNGSWGYMDWTSYSFSHSVAYRGKIHDIRQPWSVFGGRALFRPRLCFSQTL